MLQLFYSVLIVRYNIKCPVLPGTEVAVYSVDGRLIKKATATSDALSISVEDLAKGTYVLRTKNSDVKFIKQ